MYKSRYLAEKKAKEKYKTYVICGNKRDGFYICPSEDSVIEYLEIKLEKGKYKDVKKEFQL